MPYPWDQAAAPAYARDRDAALALGRAQARAAGPTAVSLSPASMRGAHLPARLVLPSPNGSAIAFALAEQVPTVIAGCLRIATAVARWLTPTSGIQADSGASVAVVAAGERWPDGLLRPAMEDLWGAGALIAQLAALDLSDLSVEAPVARVAYEAVTDDMQQASLACASGQELVHTGYRGNADIAAEVDTSKCVPLLRDESFTNQTGH